MGQFHSPTPPKSVISRGAAGWLSPLSQPHRTIQVGGQLSWAQGKGAGEEVSAVGQGLGSATQAAPSGGSSLPFRGRTIPAGRGLTQGASTFSKNLASVGLSQGREAPSPLLPRPDLRMGWLCRASTETGSKRGTRGQMSSWEGKSQWGGGGELSLVVSGAAAGPAGRGRWWQTALLPKPALDMVGV